MVAVQEGRYGRELIARCDDQTIWSLVAGTDGAWTELPSIPQGTRMPLPQPSVPDVPVDVPADPNDDATPINVLFKVDNLTLEEPKPVRVVDNDRWIADLVFDCQLPKAWIGEEREVYLLGFPEQVGLQFFARTKNRWLCAGADNAKELSDISKAAGQPIETQESGWSSVKVARFGADGRIVFEWGKLVAIRDLAWGDVQIGEDRVVPPNDTKTTRPAGVHFNFVVGYAA